MNVDDITSEQESFGERLKKFGCKVVSEPGKRAVLLNENPSSPSSIRPGKYVFFGTLELRTYPENNTQFLRAKADAMLLIENKQQRVVDIFTVSSLLSTLSTCQIGNNRVSGNTLLNRQRYSNRDLIDKKRIFIEEFILGKEIEVIETSKANVVTWRWAESQPHELK